MLIPFQNRHLTFLALFCDLHLHLTVTSLSCTREPDDMRSIILEDADWREEKVSSSGVISLHVLCPEEEEILVSLVRFENWKESVLFHNFQS